MRQSWALLLVLIGIGLFAKNNNLKDLSNKKEQVTHFLNSDHTLQQTSFEFNKGQFESNFNYRYSNSQACVDFYSEKIVFSLRKVTKKFNPQKIDEPMEFEYISWHIDILDSKLNEILPTNLRTTNVNYFDANGNHIQKELADAITYKNVYPNIDLVFYTSKNGALKYDFILHPGAMLSSIKLKYSGVQNLRVDDDGKLQYETPWGTMSEDIPYSYYTKNQSELTINYRVEDSTLRFNSNFDIVEEELVLDPIYVDWSSYFYGNGLNGLTYSYTWVYDLDIDDDQHVYVTGITNDKFPGIENAYDTSNSGYYDAFVCKMSAEGDSILWFSYLGGSSYEYCFSLAVNANQEPVVSGFTWSTDFPITSNAYDKTPNIRNGIYNYYVGFVTKFSSKGDSLIFSTFLGGSNADLIQSIELDDSNYVFVTGQTNSPDFPTTSGAYQTKFGGSSTSGSYWSNSGDVFLTKIKPDGSGLVFSTFIGGVYDEVAYEIAISSKRDIYLVGKTTSTNFPTTIGSPIFNYGLNGVSDAFICKVNAAGSSLLYSKMMGGDNEDWFEGIYVNEKDEAYVAGITRSSNFYTTKNAYQKYNNGGADVVVVKFNPGGQNVYYSTYLGGSGDELYYSGFVYNSNVRIAANVKEEAIICGITRSNDYPVTSDALMNANPSNKGTGWWNTSATITKLDYFGSKVLYATYYGGSNYEVPGANKLKRISCYTNILYGGFTSSSDYPTTKGVFRESRSTSTNNYWSGFVSKFSDTLYTDLISLSSQDTIYECDQVHEIMNSRNIGADILWSNGKKSQYQIIQDTGLIWVQATYGCDTVRDSVYIVLKQSPKIPALPADSIYCDSFPSLVLNAKNDTIEAKFTWSTGDTSQQISIDTPGIFWVDIQTQYCGTKRDEVRYKFLKTPQPILPFDSVFCNTIDIILQVGDSAVNEEQFLWSNNDTASFSRFVDTGIVRVAISNFCGSDSASIRLSKIISPLLTLPPDSQFCDQVDIWLKYGDSGNDEYYSIINLDTKIMFNTKNDSSRITMPGNFAISSKNKCGTSIDSIYFSLINTPNISIGKDTTFCDQINFPIQVGKANNDEEYLWENGSVQRNRYIDKPGKYWVQTKNKCGISSDTCHVKLVQSPTVSLPMDSVFCDAIQWVLDVDLTEPSIYNWNIGSNDSAIVVKSPGLYQVSISNYCGVVEDSIFISKIVTPTLDLGENMIFCGTVIPQEFTIGISDNEETYTWSNGSLSSKAIYQTEGKHWAQISNKCATISDSIEFTVSPNPIVDLGPDTTLCGNFSITLDAGNPGLSYLWMPFGETTKTIQATEQIKYSVTVYNANGCKGSDKYRVKPDCISKSYIPNAFSPNQDGLNDIFKPVLINFQEYTLSIYNRWGELIYTSNDIDLGWDGSYLGKPLPNGIYLYKMRYKTTEDFQWNNKKGTLNLIR